MENELSNDSLESLMDRYGLPRVLAALAEIAHAKAQHVQTNWQDKHLSLQPMGAAMTETILERLHVADEKDSR